MAKKETKPAAKDWGILGRIGYVLFGPATSNNARSWVVLILLILVVRWAWFEPYKIPSGSMEPTLNGVPSFFAGDRVFVDKHVYGLRVPFMNKYIFRWNDPERFDIVVFKAAHENPKHKILIKRIVGMPGERIHIGRNGEIYADGEQIEIPEDLQDILYYTRGITLPRENFREIMLNDLAMTQGKLDMFLYWNDLAKAFVVESALRGQVPGLINEDHPSYEQYKSEMERIQGLLQEKDIRSVAAANEAGITESVGQQAMLVAKEILIVTRGAQMGLEPDMNSIIYHQPTVEQFYEDLEKVRAGIQQEGGDPLEGIADSTYRIVSELWRMQQQDMTPFYYGILNEDEYAVVPDDHYMMLGDNSGNSVDSRVYGWVPREHIVGRMFAIWLPPSRWRDFTGWTGTWYGMAQLIGIPLAFLLIGYVHHAIRRSVRVKGDIGLPGHSPGGKIIVNCASYGLRYPFLNMRMTRGPEPEIGEFVMCKVGHSYFIGAVAKRPGDDPKSNGLYAIDVKDDDHSETYHVARRDIIGRARAAGATAAAE